MRINEQIARRHWLEAAKEQAAEEYRKQGYDVTADERLGDIEADLVARRSDETLVVEIKSKSSSPETSKAITELRNYAVHNMGAKFKLLFVSPPNEISVDVEDLDQLLLDSINESPGDLDEVATHVRVEGVDGIEIETVVYGKSSLRVAGTATVYVELQYGSDSDLKNDYGASHNDSFPLRFDLVLDPSSGKLDSGGVEVDTSSFYD